MFTRIRSSWTYANVASSLALFLALATGSAYAVNTVGSADIIDDSILSQDIKNGGVGAVDIGLNSVTSSRVVNGTLLAADLAPGAVTGATILDGQVGTADLADNAVTAADLAADSVGASEIATDGVTATEIADSSIDAGEIVDFGLSNQDVGVLFAEVNADGTLAHSSGGGATSVRLGTAGSGTYQVDFAHAVDTCAVAATIGSPTTASVTPGEVTVADRAGNAQAVFVDTNDSAGAPADKPFRLVVGC